MNRFDKQVVLIGVAMIILSIMMGALGAHALRTVLTVQQLESFETAVRYQAWQSIGLILMLCTNKIWNLKVRAAIYRLLICGVVLFSGSIYLLVFVDTPGWYRMVLGPLTPIGGVLMIVAWSWFFIHILRLKVSE